MQVKKLLLSAVCLASCASVFADTTKVTVKEKIKLHDLDCKTFVDLDPVYQGKIVYWTTSRFHEGNADAVYIDVNHVDAFVPVVVADCKSAPGSSFYEVVKAKYKVTN